MGIGSAILSLSRQSGQLIGMAVITLLLSLYFAGAAIGESDPQLLESVTTNALTVSLVTALLAAWFSWRKV
jgi:type VI protein secretion system component VasK